MREVVAEGDGDERQREDTQRGAARRARARQPHREARRDHVGQRQRDGHAQEPERVARHEHGAAGIRERVLAEEAEPGEGAREAIEGDRGEDQQHESDDTRIRRRLPEQPQRGSGNLDLAAPPGVRPRLGPARADGSQPRDHAEEDGEGLAPLEPLLAEGEDTQEVNEEVARDHRGQDGRVRRRGMDELEPGEGEEADHGGPVGGALRVVERGPLPPVPERPGARERAVEPGPWIQDGPEVAQRRVQIGQPYPPDCPDEEWQRVLQRVAAAQAPRREQRDGDRERQETRRGGERGAAGEAPDPDPDPGGLQAREQPSGHQRHEHEGGHDDEDPARHVETSRQQEDQGPAAHMRARSHRHRRGGHGSHRRHPPRGQVLHYDIGTGPVLHRDMGRGAGHRAPPGAQQRRGRGEVSDFKT